jgi:hypothetical protein
MTLKEIKSLFSDYEKHEQIDRKQLFICSQRIPKDLGYAKILVSYRTIVGYYDEIQDCWVLTREKYSRTTSKQLTHFALGRNVVYVDSL